MTRITGCRNCGNLKLAEVLDLGEQYLSDFPPAEHPGHPAAEDRTMTWPLQLVACSACGLVQLSETVPRELLYHDGYGFYSGVNEGIVTDLGDIVRHALYYRPNPAAWLDIACNDGTLLSFVPPACYRVGIDPVAKFKQLALRHADDHLTGYFPEVYARWPDPDPPRYDVITASSVFYDLDDPNAFVAKAAELLDDKGVLVVQQNSLLAMLEANAYDNVCHEHLTYWSITGFCKLLDRHGLEALDVRTGPVNGGVFRVVAGHRGVRNPAPSVSTERYRERRKLPGLLSGFPAVVRTLTQDLHELVTSIVADGARVQVVGASTRGAVIWQAARLAHADLLDAAVERNPAKVGRHYAAVGIPIISEGQMELDPPDYLLVGPWWFRDQLLDRYRGVLDHGTAMIFPLPSIEVVR